MNRENYISKSGLSAFMCLIIGVSLLGFLAYKGRKEALLVVVTIAFVLNIANYYRQEAK